MMSCVLLPISPYGHFVSFYLLITTQNNLNVIPKYDTLDLLVNLSYAWHKRWMKQTAKGYLQVRYFL